MNVSYKSFELPQAFKSAIEEVTAKHSAVFVLVDSNTAEHCLPELLGICEGLSGAEILEVEPGEASKCFEVVVHLIEHLIEQKADRRSLLVCLGGGVVTDLGGFVASIYKRGVGVMHLPTSLLAMVDAAIGGKTAIDHLEVKNVVGTFYPPVATFSYLGFLDSLPDEEVESAAFEMFKHGLVADFDHVRDLMHTEDWKSESLKPLIERSAQIKAQIILQDPFENGVRLHLNFGHTVGHALEAAAIRKGVEIPHGAAVGLGMLAELCIHQRFEWLLADEADTIIQFLKKKLDIYLAMSFDRSSVAQFLAHDKKNKNGAIHIVRLTSIGSAHLTSEVSEEVVLESIAAAGILLNA